MDPRTGLIDMDLITTGRSAASRGALASLSSEIRRLLDARLAAGQPPMTQSALLVAMQQQSSVDVPAEDLREALQFLIEDESVYVSGDPRNPTIRRADK